MFKTIVNQFFRYRNVTVYDVLDFQARIAGEKTKKIFCLPQNTSIKLLSFYLKIQ